VSPMYTNRRCIRPRVSDDSIMRDATMETHDPRVSDNSIMRDATMEMHDLRISVLHVGAFQMRLSHVVKLKTIWSN
jgi:hypothetical protein